MLDIRLFGPLRLAQGDTRPVRPPRRDVRLVLAYLLLHRDNPVPRRTAACALWPDSDESVALARLRRALHRAADALPPVPGGGGWLARDASSVHWQPPWPCTLDVATVDALDADARRAAARGDLAALRVALAGAAVLATGDLLEGDDAEWLTPLRDRYGAAAVARLAELAEACAAVGDLPAALYATTRLLIRDPLHESALRRHMAILCQAGDPAAALQAYKRFSAALEAEVSAAPQTETDALAHAIRAVHLARDPETTHRRPPSGPVGGLLARLVSVDRCVTLDEALGLAPPDRRDRARADLLDLIDHEWVIVCPGTCERARYRAVAPACQSPKTGQRRPCAGAPTTPTA